MRPSLYNNMLAKTTLSPAARTATANGTTVDRASSGALYQDALIVVATGTITDGTHTIEVQESDNGSSWTAVADTQLQGTEPAIASANDDTLYEIAYLGDKRYLRVITTVAGATTGGLYSAVVLLGNARTAPAVHA